MKTPNTVTHVVVKRDKGHFSEKISFLHTPQALISILERKRSPLTSFIYLAVSGLNYGSLVVACGI